MLCETVRRMQAPWPPAFSWLDVKLGMRKYAGPTLRYVRMRPVETLRVDG